VHPLVPGHFRIRYDFIVVIDLAVMRAKAGLTTSVSRCFTLSCHSLHSFPHLDWREGVCYFWLEHVMQCSKRAIIITWIDVQKCTQEIVDLYIIESWSNVSLLEGRSMSHKH
jgi:hypothetical protein